MITRIPHKSLFFLFVFFFSASFNALSQVSKPQWVDGIGGANTNSVPSAVGTDKQNNVYVTGIFNGTVDFDPSAGVYNLTSVAASFDTYVAKYTPTGTLVWAVSFGGSGTDQVNSITVDGGGNPTVSGQYDSSTMDADPGAGVFTLNNNGDKDAFIVRLTTNGKFSWAHSMGGFQTDYGGKIVADSQGGVVGVSQYQGAISVGGQTFIAQGSFNGLAVKYDVNGNFVWAINIADVNNSETHSCAIDANNNVIISGVFNGNDNFNPLGAATFVNGNGTATFLAKYTSAGKLIWVKSIQGNVVNNNTNLCVNSKNDVYIDGPFSSPVIFNGSKTLNAQGQQDIFIAKYNSDGVFQIANDIGAPGGSIYNYGIVASKTDEIYVSGYFSGSIDFDPSTTNAIIQYHGQRDLFLSKFDENINYKWAFSAGSANCNNTLGRNVDVDQSNAVLLVGSFCSTVDFDATTCGSYPLTAKSDVRDSFVAKYIQSVAASTAQITSFSVPGQSIPAVIDQTKLKITVTVPLGTNIKALVPTVKTSSGITLMPASGVAQNFTTPVTYQLSNANCNALNYVVEVVFATNAVKIKTICPAAPEVITGDTKNPVPGAFAWQQLKNGVWVNAPGQINGKDYVTSSLTNATAANLVYSLRRQTTTQGVIAFDSYYDVTVQSSVSLTNNVITAPAISTFCLTGDAAAINGSTPAGGTGVYTYQWQNSANGVNFTNISGATAVNYDPPAIIATTYFRRVASSGACVSPSVSNVVIMKILPAIANNSITAPVLTTYCAPGNPAVITGSTPAGGAGSFTYQWQSSINNTSFADIAGATAKNYDPATITTSTYYRRLVISTPCSTPLVSNVIKITIQSVIANNSIIAPVVTSFCVSGNPAAIAGQVPTGGNGTYIYQWQKSTDNVNFSNIAGAIAKDYDPPLVNTNTYYRRLASSGTCTVPGVSNVVNIKILTTPVVPVVAAAAATCPGSGTTLTIKTPQAGIVYNWYSSATKTVLLFSGTSYHTPNLNVATTYYVEASNGACGSALTIATVNIASPPAAPLLGSNVIAVCSGSAATASIASPQNGFIYNWYNAATGGTSLHKGVSFTTPDITTAKTYYAEATNAGGCISAKRTAVSITVNTLPQVTIANMAICPGGNATLTAVTANFTGQIAWYADNTTTTALQLNATKTFTTPVLNTARSYYVEAISSDNCKTPVRVKVDVTILQQLDAPIVTVDSTTNSTITFKWDAVTAAQGYQVSIDGGKTFASPSSGTTGLSHSVTGLQYNQQVTILVRAIGVSTCQLSGISTAVTGNAIGQAGNKVYVANAFTPNGDGNNDVVYVHSEDIKSMTFYIYDQWGELLFTSTDIKKGWDGYYKGTKEPVGVYVYFVKATMNDGAQLNKKGTITLLR